MNIELPDTIADRLAELASRRGLSSVESYLLALIEEDEDHSVRDRLEDLLMEGIESGEGIEVTPGFWEEYKRRFLERFPEAARQRHDSTRASTRRAVF